MVSWTQSTVPFRGGSEGQSFHYGSLSAAAAADRQSSQLGRPLRNVFLPAPSQSARNLYTTRSPPLIYSARIRCEFSIFDLFFTHTHTHLYTHVVVLTHCNIIFKYFFFCIVTCKDFSKFQYVLIYVNYTHESKILVFSTNFLKNIYT